MSWLKRAAKWLFPLGVVLALEATAALIISAVNDAPSPFRTDAAAAWVQAIGSIAAIAAGFASVKWQLDQRSREREEERVAALMEIYPTIRNWFRYVDAVEAELETLMLFRVGGDEAKIKTESDVVLDMMKECSITDKELIRRLISLGTFGRKLHIAVLASNDSAKMWIGMQGAPKQFHAEDWLDKVTRDRLIWVRKSAAPAIRVMRDICHNNGIIFNSYEFSHRTPDGVEHDLVDGEF